MGVKLVVQMPYKTGLAEDVSTNTFAFGGVSSGDAEVPMACQNFVDQFYSAVLPGTSFELGHWLSPVLSRTTNACTWKAYNIGPFLDGSPHGSPFATGAFTLTSHDSAIGLPDEVACCVTLEAALRANQRVEVADGADPDSKPDRPRQRYTGRIYLGPLNSNTLDEDPTTGAVRPNGAFNTAVRGGLNVAAQGFNTNTLGWLGVWSRKDEAIREADNIVFDNAYDTQRRRGIRATTRTRSAITAAGQNVELAA